MPLPLFMVCLYFLLEWSLLTHVTRRSRSSLAPDSKLLYRGPSIRDQSHYLHHIHHWPHSPLSYANWRAALETRASDKWHMANHVHTGRIF
jgi:hypothetical protein